ncbi:TonB-dependent receptor [Hymenobacter busanensis]|uniref:TonB-dependent receptor n=1 Tax=Hymenobacter busanensis TaxID=2607656 RepID=A0A7L5A2J6_9BACT|nr:TonB-dependent receptor [Hymenobacter busanensis]QHJ09751.1 TonB-dependent receptor [Hymenobacter busanensis]
MPGAAFLLLLGHAAWAQGPVSGTITDGRNGQALPGATITLDGAPAGVADASGAFSLPAVPAGAHELRVTFIGYQASTRRVLGQAAPQQVGVALPPADVLTGEAVVTATRANERTATAYTNLSREELQKRNFGQDIPYLLDQTPSVVVSSDAGAGVGYTGIRIRGVDVTGINVTINGVPLNDAESHGAFFVNTPDLASSIQDIQVQRGVGTSTNGGAAFGASLNIRTLSVNRDPYAETQNTYGSFNTWRNTVSFGSGLVGGKYTFDGRLSRISSDGYIDRASSDLKSYYFAAGYQQKNTMLKFVTFSGREKTYQAWDGAPEALVNGDAAALEKYIAFNYIEGADAENLRRAGRRYNVYTYDNQVDNYQQNHYQLHFSQGLGQSWNLGVALHLTRGFGYYEQFRADNKLANYGLPPVVVGTAPNTVTISRTDLIRRKWLDNYFYGATYALNYQPHGDDRLSATLGGGWNRYAGDHYGEVIWARYASTSSIRQRYYFNEAEKTDFNVFAKATYQVAPRVGLFADLQLRTIDYQIKGVDDDKRDVTTRASYTFFNPKAGLTFTVADGQQLYSSFAVGHREPVRSDFTDRPADDRARAERLHDVEAGYRFRFARPVAGLSAVRGEVNYFYMNYRNQLVATGQLNDVGTALRTNIPSSYRTGVELTVAAVLGAERLSLNSTLTLSRNRLRRFQETIYVYDQDYNVLETQLVERSNSAISYSPSVVSATTAETQVLKGLRVALLYKTVSRQYLDNSASAARSLKPYQVADLRLRYSVQPSFVRELEFSVLVGNLFNQRYAAAGYTYGGLYQLGEERLVFNFLSPQATRNFLATVGIKF